MRQLLGTLYSVPKGKRVEAAASSENPISLGLTILLQCDRLPILTEANLSQNGVRC
jgi:hypothetical protein